MKLLFVFATAISAFAAGPQTQQLVDIEAGAASFKASTNMPGVESSAMWTMKVRDEHAGSTRRKACGEGHTCRGKASSRRPSTGAGESRNLVSRYVYGPGGNERAGQHESGGGLMAEFDVLGNHRAEHDVTDRYLRTGSLASFR
jgi:hypothetical protein